MYYGLIYKKTTGQIEQYCGRSNLPMTRADIGIAKLPAGTAFVQFEFDGVLTRDFMVTVNGGKVDSITTSTHPVQKPPPPDYVGDYANAITPEAQLAVIAKKLGLV